MNEKGDTVGTEQARGIPYTLGQCTESKVSAGCMYATVQGEILGISQGIVEQNPEH